MPMRLTPATCPTCGGKPYGTLETIPGVAQLSDPSADGLFDYAGETDINWDGQVSVKPAKGLGDCILVCEDDHEWNASKELV